MNKYIIKIVTMLLLSLIIFGCSTLKARADEFLGTGEDGLDTYLMDPFVVNGNDPDTFDWVGYYAWLQSLQGPGGGETAGNSGDEPVGGGGNDNSNSGVARTLTTGAIKTIAQSDLKSCAPTCLANAINLAVTLGLSKSTLTQVATEELGKLLIKAQLGDLDYDFNLNGTPNALNLMHKALEAVNVTSNITSRNNVIDTGLPFIDKIQVTDTMNHTLIVQYDFSKEYSVIIYDSAGGYTYNMTISDYNSLPKAGDDVILLTKLK